MTPAEAEFARMLARSGIGADLRAIEARLTRLVRDEIFGELDDGARRQLEQHCAEAGGRALYAFVAPFADAVADFSAEHPQVAVQHDQPPAASTPPRAGEWIRVAGAAGGAWHLFGGDLRLRVDGRRSATFAETRCGRAVPLSAASGPADLERSADRPDDGTCRACRRISVRASLRARRRAP